MPKVPVQTESERYNPYVTKSISRTLLTPCRQVGLSRKRKTPNSVNNSFSEINTTQVVSPASNLNTTPLSSNTSLNNDTTKENEKTVKSEVTSDSKNKKKNRVSKRLIPEESDLKNDSQFACLNNNDTPEENKAPVESDTSKGQVSKTYVTDDDVCLSSLKNTKLSENETPKKQMSDKNKSKSKSGKKKSKRKVVKSDVEDIIIVENKEENASPGGSKENPDTIERSPYFQETEHFAKNVPLKTYSRGNSKQIRSATITVEVVDTKIEPEATVLKNVTNKEVPTKTRKSPRFSPIKPSSEATNVVPVKSKKIKRILSLGNSSYEDETEKSLNLETTDFKNSNITSEIEELEKQIKEKQKLVDEFKQAEIYRKKHDIKELEELTSRWKTGCILALNDLLPLLQAHGTIDMATLLHNLNVPKELVTLSQNGDLI